MGFSQFTVIGGIEFKHLRLNYHGEKYYFDKLIPDNDTKWFLTEDEFIEETKDMPTHEIEHRFAEMVNGKVIVDAVLSDINPNNKQGKENGSFPYIMLHG